MAKKKKKWYKNPDLLVPPYEEGSLMDEFVKQVDKHGASSLVIPTKRSHDYLRSKGFFSAPGTLPKKKVEPSGLKGKAKVMKKGGKVSRIRKSKAAGSSIKTYGKGGYVEGE